MVFRLAQKRELGLAIALFCFLAWGPAMAQPDHIKPTFSFDIPAQSLDAALRQFGDRTSHEALYDASLVVGKRSRDVQGNLRPAEALDKLLAGTGLTARYLSESVFLLLPHRSVPMTRDSFLRPPDHQRYYALLQHTLFDALCQSRGTRPGRYRLVLLLWLQKNGRIERFQRVGTTGNRDADGEVDARIGAVRLSDPVPAEFEQPVLIVILPQAAGVTSGCSDTGRWSGGAMP